MFIKIKYKILVILFFILTFTFNFSNLYSYPKKIINQNLENISEKKNNLISNESIKNDSTKSGLIKTDSTKSVITKTGTTNIESTKSGLIKTDSTKSGFIKNDSIKSDSIKSDYNKNESLNNGNIKDNKLSSENKSNTFINNIENLNKIESKKSLQENGEYTKLEIQVILNDNRQLKGIATFEAPSKIESVHLRDGIKYKKVFQINDIDYIELKTWKPKYYKSNSVGDIFSFEVSSFFIHLKSGYHLKQIGPLFSFLKEFSVTNEYGEVYVYTYWLDLYQKDGTWNTGLNGELGAERNIAHNEVVKKIIFKNLD